MSLLRPTLGALLLAASLPGHAQTSAPATDAAAAPRYYVGLAAYTSFYQPIGRLDDDYIGAIRNSTFRLPVQLTAGYRISPRLAVQVGLAYSTASAQYGLVTVFNSPTPGAPSPYSSYESHNTQTQLATSVLGRYTLTANPAHRLQVDALGGFTLERSLMHNQGIYTDGSQSAPVSSPFDNRYTRNTLLLTGGVGARYRLSSHFELTYDFSVNKALNSNNGSGGIGGGSGFNTLTSSHALGLRYRFGR